LRIPTHNKTQKTWEQFFFQGNQVIGTEFLFTERYLNSILFLFSQRYPEYLLHFLQTICISTRVCLFASVILGYLNVVDLINLTYLNVPQCGPKGESDFFFFFSNKHTLANHLDSFVLWGLRRHSHYLTMSPISTLWFYENLFLFH
jgi:hypothetical protein